MSDEFVVPEGWSRTTLGQVGRYLNGRAFKTQEWSKSGRPIIRIQDLTGSNRNPNYFAGEVEDRYVVRAGDLLISWSATLGAYIWDGPEAVLNQHIFKVESKIDKRFHYHLARERIHELERNAHGSGMVHVTKGVFDQTPVAVPDDLGVQRQLAELIDKADALQVSSASHLAAARRAVERFRQAVLAAACSGRLTADWREVNDTGENADDLVGEIEAARRERLGKRFKPSVRPVGDTELPERWTWTSVGALLDVATGATPLRKRSDYFGGSIPWVTSGAVNAGEITTAKEFITELAIRETNAKVFPAGTLLVAMYGEGQTRGRVGELRFPAATNQAVAALLFDEATERLRDYMRIFFEGNYERIRQLSFGGVQPNLSLGVIRDTSIPMPPLDEQVEIVRRVRRLLALGAGLEARIDAATRRVDRNSQAVLAKAFRGELPVAPEMDR